MVIINADDFGMNERCSRAIAEAFSRELVTDTTIMANGEYFNQAILLAEKNGFFRKIGIHLNITEGAPLTEDIKNLPDFVTDGQFNKRYNWDRKLTAEEETAIHRELTAQIVKVQKEGVRITHADSHHYIHNAPFIAPIAERVCSEHGIAKIRLMRNWGDMADSDKQKAEKYKERLRSKGYITTEYFGRLSETENKKPPESIELLVHPDFDKDGNLIDRHGVEGGYPVGSIIPELNVMLGGYLAL